MHPGRTFGGLSSRMSREPSRQVANNPCSVRAHASSAIVCLFCITLLPGCADQSYKKARMERDARIAKTAGGYAKYNASGFDRMSYVAGVSRKQRERQQQSLDATLKHIEETNQRDLKRWNDQQKNRQSWWNRIFKGKPEEIDGTFAKMTY